MKSCILFLQVSLSVEDLVPLQTAGSRLPCFSFLDSFFATEIPFQKSQLCPPTIAEVVFNVVVTVLNALAATIV